MTVRMIKLLPILLLVLVQLNSYAQIGINSDNSIPDPSAMLDVSSTSSGVLTPRMTQAERDAITDPATSLLIYQTDNTSGFYYNSGIPDTPNWVLIGNDENTAICDSRIPMDSVARFSNYSGRYVAYLITEPGSYYLTDNIEISETSATAIYINSDNVTIDLNGFYINGPGADNSNSGTSDGIFIIGEKYNLTFKNGKINGFGNRGVDGSQIYSCLFQDIVVSNCGDNGFWIGYNSVITECHAYGNGIDGYNALNGCNFIRCTASENGDDGIQATSGSQFINCTAFSNGGTGIFGSNDTLVAGCVVSDNEDEGIDVSQYSLVHQSTAHDNEGAGIEAGSNSRVSFCNATLNSSDGIRLIGSSGVVYGCVVHENDEAGIHTSSTNESRIIIEGNGVTDNDTDGIWVEGPGAIVISNRASGNYDASSSANNQYDLHPDTNHGPIINIDNQGDLNTVSGADHPYANFDY